MARRSKGRSRPVSEAVAVSTSETFAPDITQAWWSAFIRALVISAATLWIYWPALHGGWLWDDDSYITDNRLLHSMAGLGTFWFQPGAFRDWYPLEETVLWLEWHLWGLNTLGYHLVNVVLHIANALLVWRLLARFDLRWAWLGGLLFAIHPVQVESVAWISELKNTLSQLFILLAMTAYLDADARKIPRAYWLALGFFVLAVLCKLSVVLFPFVILLHAWWKRGRIGAADFRGSAPFFVVALLAGLVTTLGGVWGRQFSHLAPHFLPPDGVLGRLALAGLSFAFYVSKALLPIRLLPVYPLWPVHPLAPVTWLPWLVLAAVIAWCWQRREGWGRHVLFGLGFFLINLLPCPGFLPAPNMGYAWVMDHFLYLPLLGLIGLVIAGSERLAVDLSPVTRRAAGVLAIALLIALTMDSHACARLYRDSQTLWTYTLARNPQAWPGHNNLGKIRQAEGRYDDAIAQYRQALAIEPSYAEAHYNLGLALQQAGRLPEAMQEYQRALQIKSDYAKAHNDLGNALLLAGRVPEAIDEYHRALQINPDFADAHNDLGSAFQRKNEIPQALAEFETALQLDPEDAQAHFNRALILQQTGRLPEAIADYRQAIALKPDDAPARRNLEIALRLAGESPDAANPAPSATPANDAQNHYNQGLLLQRSGRLAEAEAEYQQALQINPDDEKAHYNLGTALAQSGQFPEATVQFQAVVRLVPNSIQARNNLAVVLAKTGRIPEAIEQLKDAQQIDPDNADIARNLAKLESLQPGATPHP
jgi:tetratricopeptide (TPR) repeat protein